MIIATNIENWDKGIGMILAQNDTTLICYVDDVQGYEYQKIDEIPNEFEQRVHPGRFGTYMTLAQINQVTRYKSKLTEAEIDEASNITELRLMYENAIHREEIDALAMELLKKKGVL